MLGCFREVPQLRVALAIAGVALAMGPRALSMTYSWQEPHSVVKETGDLEWKPEPFRFEAGSSVRYIDYGAGDDANDGLSQRSPWKHHPWDPEARGNAAACEGVHTYVFKRGVAYRGELLADESGRPGDPIRLTSDPFWGEGEAVICGSEMVGGWRKGADHPDIPEPEKVWYADLDFAPRNVWMVEPDGSVVRIELARTPNWKVTDPDDIKSEWWTWNNPDKPFDNYIEIDGQRLHFATDTEHLTRPADYYQDAIVWTTYGWVMGTPYPTYVRFVDTEKKALAFACQWGAISYKIIRHCRYYLEDKPHYLDEPGEFWFAKEGRGGRLYIRLPGDIDPNSAHIEVAKRIHMIESQGMSHVHVSGLTFRFTNVYWDLTALPPADRDVDPGCVRLLGSGSDIRVTHCRFEHVHKPIRLKAVGRQDAIGDVVVADNEFLYADHGATEIADSSEWGDVLPPMGRLYDVKVMRNRCLEIGHRPTRYGQGHAMEVGYAETLEVAGNILDRCYGAGLFLFGGKQSGAATDRPLSRMIVHHNKVTDSLLNNNDWGGIETWQGGPAYVYDNISGNPGGYRNWAFMLERDTPASARFGHAYYLDGAFKNYHFNNIAWGKSKDPFSRLGNTAAFQEIHSYQNTFFNNTIYNFVKGSRRQAPQAGRDKFLGNVWEGIGYWVFRHAEPANTAAEGNAADAGPQKEHFALDTDAFSRNVFYDLSDYFGVLEPSGRWHQSLESFRQVLQAHNALASDVGEVADGPLLRDAAAHDFRLAPESAARDKGVRAFVPWALYAMVAEWNFYRAPGDPTHVMDEHWYLTPYHVVRDDYYKRPMYPLTVVNVGPDDYVQGPLEDWTDGALSLNGKDQYAAASNAALTEAFEYQVSYRPPDWVTMTFPTAMAPGQPFEAKLELRGVEAGLKLHGDLHWTKKDGQFMGMNAWGGAPKEVTGPGPYTFSFTPQDKPDLGSFVLAVYLTKTGDWEDRTLVATVEVPAGDAAGQTRTVTMGGENVTETRTASGEDLKSPQVHGSNFLLEAYFKTAPGRTGGVLIEKMRDAGYSLSVNDGGGVTFAARGPGGSADVASVALVNDGAWHHVIAEADRKAGALTLYVDGRKDASGPGLGVSVSLANDGDLYVGGTPEGRCLAGAVDFMRIALGTLADARTTIEELYEWEFNGPSARDFTGREPADGKRDAGALELVGD